MEFVQCRLGPGLDLQLYFEWNHVDCFGIFCFSGLDLLTIVHVAWLLMQHCWTVKKKQSKIDDKKK